jgi:aspartate-semialdehyde dehydrogenase
MKIALVGATGMVGEVMMKVLTEEQIKVTEFVPVASERSVGKKLSFLNKEWTVKSLNEAVAMNCDFALFSAGGDTSLEWAPKFAVAGTTVIDNSSAWRMDANTPLIIPEINGHILKSSDKIIANPNCSTIQLLLALMPLHKAYAVERVVVSTYQSITGTGVKAVQQMDNERNGVEGEMAYAYPIDKNCIPHCDVFTENGYTKEEMKLTNETKKILDPNIKLTATAVRVPVVGGHSEAVNVQFEKDFDLDEVRGLLSATPGITVQDNLKENLYPMPRMAAGKNDVFVGRIRRDDSQDKTLNMWVVSDNLRKGAATNAVQILKHMIALKEKA